MAKNVTLGLLHWNGSEEAVHPENPIALCGALIVHPRQITEVVDYLTCEDCIIRFIAALRQQEAIVLRTLAGRVVALRAQAESAVKRD